MSFSPAIPPTIGRVVWFYPPTNSGETGFAPPPAGEPLAAVIAHVHGPAMVNLSVFDANGVPHSRTSVNLYQDGEPVPDSGRYCTWMPFQKGQARAQEAIKSPATVLGLPVVDTMTPATRTIEDHKVNPANDTLTITVLDQPGSGGAQHLYMVEGFDTASNPSDPFTSRHGAPARHATILFQNGPIPDVGVNGVTHEVLLAIVADRLRSFQKGPFACKANACALTHIEEAQHWLQQRTIERMRRGVEGTHTV